MKIFIVFFSLLFLSTAALADFDNESELKNAFQEIKHSLYKLYAKRDFCNRSFADFVDRNNEAYKEWELQYSFFLRDFDTKYFDWKKGFNTLQKQQLTVLEEIEQLQASKKINEDYSDGARDKCYNFKPALSRPRNNLELNHQDAINLIRLEANQGFPDSHNTTGAKPLCIWQQNKALSITNKRNQNIEEKQLKTELKAFKKSDDGLSKEQKKSRVNAYDDMIKEAYDFPMLHSTTFSIYRLAQCEFKARDIDTRRLKKINDDLLRCQKSSADNDLLLAKCTVKLIPEK